MRHLERLGIADKTIIVFISDNGPEDANGADPRTFGSEGPFDGLQQMVRVGDWVALRTRIREGGAKVRLYNVAEDPFQSCDRSGDTDQQSRLAEMTAILDKRLHE